VTQHRDLVPVTVYLPPDKLAEAEEKAREEYVAVSAYLRRLILEAMKGA